MIGLKRMTVRVVEYDPGWADIGEDIRVSIQKILSKLDLEIEHVGSTSVPGLAAKPIIDIVVGMRNVSAADELTSKLTNAGYIDRGIGAASVGHVFVWEPEPDFRSVHVHVVAYATSHWDDYVRFRDILRADDKVRDRYERLKLKSAFRFAKDRKAYTASKDELVREILDC